MKKAILISSIVLSLVGCSSETSTNNDNNDKVSFNEKRIATKACMEHNYWLYKGECVNWEDIPVEDQEIVLNDVADIVSKVNGVSHQEALDMMRSTIK